MRKSVGIIGASGLLGSHLAAEYESMGWEVVRFSRERRNVKGQEWREFSKQAIKGLDVLVNLAGERIDLRWTEQNKKLFWESRVTLTQQVANMIASIAIEDRPKVWVNASAVGLYGDGGDGWLAEETRSANGYLAELCSHWEGATRECDVSPCRVIVPRIGVVLGSESAAWKKMATVFKLGIGGKLGSGRQWFPWIHIDDICGAIAHLSDMQAAEGIYNLAAPGVVRNADFTHALAEEFCRPAIIPAPAFALRLVLGEFADALLASQRVSSEKLSQTGYKWRYPELKSALKQLNAG